MTIQPNGAGYRPEIEDVPRNLSDEQEDDYIKCECGSNEFYAVEDYFWDVQFSKEFKEAVFTNSTSEIKEIRCKKCEKLTDMPQGYQYNFN